MSHLTLETLARLVDDVADPTEAGHLDVCAQCRNELEALRADAAALHALPDPEPSAAQWLRLEHRLEREGIMRRTWRWQPTLLRMAAALVIFVLGAVSASLIMRPRERQLMTANDTPVRTVNAQPETVYVPATRLAENAEPAPVHAAAAATVASTTARTPEEAVARLRSAETDYLAALTRYTELSGRTEAGDPLARLAALESIVATTRAALGRAPADPVINGYHLTAVAQRDALLRQVSASGSTWY